MPVRRFRDVSEMEGNTWHPPGSPELFRAIRETWDFAERTLRRRYPPGVYKHRSIEEAQQLREKWEQDCFEEYQARRAKGGDGAPIAEERGLMNEPRETLCEAEPVWSLPTLRGSGGHLIDPASSCAEADAIELRARLQQDEASTSG
jgi:hypothetical protein